MLTSGFSMQGFPKLGLGVPATYGIKVGLKKLESWATCRWKPHDPRFISFDAYQCVTDRQTCHL